MRYSHLPINPGPSNLRLTWAATLLSGMIAAVSPACTGDGESSFEKRPVLTADLAREHSVPRQATRGFDPMASDASTSKIETSNDPNDSDDLPTLAKGWSHDFKKSVGTFLHALLFYRLGSTDLPSYPSGKSLFKAITHEPTAIRVFGESPFVETRYGIRYRDVADSNASESHRDIGLATFAALRFPLDLPIHVGGQKYSIADLLSESIANFYMEQREPAWTAMAYAYYLPPHRRWRNRYGEEI